MILPALFGAALGIIVCLSWGMLKYAVIFAVGAVAFGTLFCPPEEITPMPSKRRGRK